MGLLNLEKRGRSAFRRKGEGIGSGYGQIAFLHLWCRPRRILRKKDRRFHLDPKPVGRNLSLRHSRSFQNQKCQIAIVTATSRLIYIKFCFVHMIYH